jgi:hypothetical protein
MTNEGSPGDGPARRWRFDVLAGGLAAIGRPEAARHSGRRFVIAAVLVVLAIWGALYLAFRDWRTRYLERATFGARQVAPAIDPLADVVPLGVEAGPWRLAVAETHRMLVTLTASNLLDEPQMRELRDRLTATVTQATPATALGDLASLWDDLEDRAGPVLSTRHPRPRLLPPHPPVRERGMTQSRTTGPPSRTIQRSAQ